MIAGDSWSAAQSTPAARVNSARPKKWTSPATGSAAHCRALVGKSFSGPHEQAVLQMLRTCLGPALSATALAGQGIDLRRGDPRPGDLVLFHNTDDRNRNQRSDDLFTEAGAVISVQQKRVRFIYLRQGEVQLGVMNLAQPNRRRIRGPTIHNTYLRVIHPDDGPDTRYLAGQLLAGFTPVPQL